MIVTPGIPERDHARAAALYWHAFGSKLGLAMGPEPLAMAFIARVLRPDHALCAHDRDGRLLGVVGFKTAEGALVGGDLGDMQAIYGRIGAGWRSLLLTMLERDADDARFLLDGIFVAPEARGRGVGTLLLEAVAREAVRRGYAEVRLDVIDSNPRARALYERRGFHAVDGYDIGMLRHVFGFRSATTMVRRVMP